ncbi:MAG TPA: caspase family protein, partial [Polyangiaceae bacterium]|nr:caspase family protein [Polyangiaceae bacterium]
MRLRASLTSLAISLLPLAAVSPPAFADAVPHLRRVAVLIGANEAPPGRQTLRFAHEDAKRMADVLLRVGQFAANDVHVLLDPHPGEVLAAIDDADHRARGAGGEALVLFYYSGHSDGQAVFPHGETLAIADVRDHLTRSGARIRVGVLDTCRGGGWTQTKGLTVGPALDPVDLLSVATEGTALVASSSGLENAHEGEAVRGSFFTHYFAAGLLGAADRSGDGEVTLQEAFDYAKERTVRDTARLPVIPQHPSFDIRLRGRQDIVLASLTASSSALQISPPRASLEVIHLDSGLVIAEAPPGDRPLRLAVAPGHYLVRRVEGIRVWAKEIDVHPGETATVSEGELELLGSPQIAMKGEAPGFRAIDGLSSPPKGWWVWRLALGVSTGPGSSWGGVSPYEPGSASLERSAAGDVSLAFGITDRLTWLVPLPFLAYRFGNEGGLEVIPTGGVTSIAYDWVHGQVFGSVGLNVNLRAWVSPSLSLIGAAGAVWGNLLSASNNQPQPVTNDYRTALGTSLGFAWDAAPAVTFHLAAGFTDAPKSPGYGS